MEGPVDIVPISRSHFGAAIEPVSNHDRFEVGFIGFSMIFRPFGESDSRESFSPRGPNRRLPQSDLKQESFLFQIVAKLFGPTFLDEKVELYNC